MTVLPLRLRLAALGLSLLWHVADVQAIRAASSAPVDTSTVMVVTERGAYRFSVELAATPARRSRGLQDRLHLAADAGMLFDFGRVRTASMWMKDTPLSLDMLFIAADGRIVNIVADTVPRSLAVIRSSEPVLGVLEVRAGTARRLGIRPGDRVEHPIFAGALD